MKLDQRKKDLAVLLAIGAFAALAVSTTAFNGIPYGNDLTQHYQFAATVSEALSNYHYYPSLSPLANGGAGDYGLRFYPPAGYYALALAFKITGSWFSASILTFFLVYFTGGLGVYLWAREEFQLPTALIASALFVFAPYHLNQIYNNFLFAEFAASAVIPFCFLFLHRTASRPSISSAAGLAIAYGLLILTHLPSLIFCSIAFATYGLIVVYRCRTWSKALPALSGAVAAAVAATSFYWIKLVTELSWVRHSQQEYFSGIYSYGNNFLLNPASILNFNSDVQAIWLGDLMLFGTLLIAIPSLILLLKQKRKAAPILVASLGTLALSVFMTSILSKPVWDNVAFLQKIQFPWRWMGVISVTASVFAAYGIAEAGEKMKQKTAGTAIGVVLAAGLLVFVLTAVFVTKQSVFLSPRKFTNDKVAAMLTGPSRDCWWTVWTKEGFYRNGDHRLAAGGRKADISRWEPLEREAIFEPGDRTEAVFFIQYYPYWRAYADGEPVPVSRTENGLLKIEVPFNARTVSLRFREPFSVRTADAVSAAAFALIAFALFFSLASGRARREPGSETVQHRLAD